MTHVAHVGKLWAQGEEIVLKQKEPGLHPEHWEHLAAGSSAPFPVLGASPPTPLGDCFCPWAWGPWADLP